MQQEQFSQTNWPSCWQQFTEHFYNIFTFPELQFGFYLTIKVSFGYFYLLLKGSAKLTAVLKFNTFDRRGWKKRKS